MTGINRLLFLTVIMLFLAFQIVSAAPIETTVSAVRDSIHFGDQAVFEVRIKNNQATGDTFRISQSGFDWSVRSDPLHHYFTGVNVAAGSSETVTLILTPLQHYEAGRYRADFTIESKERKTSNNFSLIITIRPNEPLLREYLHTVARLVVLPPVVIPNESFNVTFNLPNRNPKAVSEFKIVMSSRFINRNVTIPLKPLETKIHNETFSLDPFLAPEKDVLEVKFYADGVFLGPNPIEEHYEIGVYSEIIPESSDTRKSFLKTTEKTTYRNRGNVKNSVVIELETNRIESFFTKSVPDQISFSREGRFYRVWEFTLEPDQDVTVTRTVSYRSMVVIVIILIAGVMFFYLMRSPVQVIKRVSIVHLSGGGISELKVIVHLKNVSGEHFERITIADKIPLMADVKSDHDLGSVKPDSVHVHDNQTTVKWEIDKLEKGEERILSYSMKTRLPIVGAVSLPGVSVRFYSEKDTKLLTKSRGVVAKA